MTLDFLLCFVFVFLGPASVLICFFTLKNALFAFVANFSQYATLLL